MHRPCPALRFRAGAVTQRAVLAGVVLVSTHLACRAPDAQRPVAHVRIATGEPGAGFHLLTTALARFYSEALADVAVSVDPLGASVVNLNALDKGDVDLAFASADIAYAAYARGTPIAARPHARLRGIATVAMSQLHVIVRADGPRSIADLRGRRLAYRVAGADDTPYLGLMSAAAFWPPSAVDAVGMPLEELRQALAAGRIDGAFAFSSYPSAPLQELASQVPIRLLEIEPDAAMRIRAEYPFYKADVIPATPYGIGQDAVRTVGVEVVMLGREGLDEELVYRLTRTLVEGRRQLAERFWNAMSVDPEVAPATPVPIHRGAARYFRERELLD